MFVKQIINKKAFKIEVQIAISKGWLSNRQISEKLGIPCSTFTRIDQLDMISTFNFITVSNWARHTLGLSWSEWMDKILITLV